MLSESLSLREFDQPKVNRGIARFLSPGPSFALHSLTASDRGQVEQYIFNRYQKNYAANIRHFLPQLLTMCCDGQLSAAVGVGLVQGEAMFLEQYLSEPIEKALENISGHAIERQSIVEIGNLVASKRGSSQLIYLIMTSILEKTRSEWVVFTATSAVRKSIRRLGFTLHQLGDANPASLVDPDCVEDWGSYYDSRPQVVAGNLSEAATIMAERKIYKYLISRFQSTIVKLATQITTASDTDHMHF
ncbi:MAG: hypothetical protein ACI9H8_000967 [Lysobacterales bacterium]|jgi:hypothetical protein